MSENKDKQSFWEHLDVLRIALMKVAVVTVAFGIIAFAFKEILFAVVLAPKGADFITYRWLAFAGELLPGGKMSDFNVQLINTGLAEQFIIHMKTALCAGILGAAPYILYQLFRFVSPALYSNERRYAIRVVGWGYVMFMIGVVISYFLIFPLTFRFLGTYQVAGDITNMITLQSYMSTLVVKTEGYKFPVITIVDNLNPRDLST